MSGETIANIMRVFCSSPKRCIRISVSSDQGELSKSITVKLKKYFAEDKSLGLIIEMIFKECKEEPQLEACPILIGYDEIDEAAEEIMSTFGKFLMVMDIMKIGHKFNFDEDCTDIAEFEDVRDIEQDEIKKFLIKNNYKLYKAEENKRETVAINKLAEFLESCLDPDIRGVSVILNVKDIGAYSINLKTSELDLYEDIPRICGIMSSNIFKDPFAFYCVNPLREDLYNEKAKDKVIRDVQEYIDSVIKAIKEANNQDKIKVQCICTVVYKFEKAEGFYDC